MKNEIFYYSNDRYLLLINNKISYYKINYIFIIF